MEYWAILLLSLLLTLLNDAEVKAMQTAVHCTITGLSPVQIAANDGGQLVARFFYDGNVFPVYGKNLYWDRNPETRETDLKFEALSFGHINADTWLHDSPETEGGQVWEALLDAAVVALWRRTMAVAWETAEDDDEDGILDDEHETEDERVYARRRARNERRGRFPPPRPHRMLEMEVGYITESENGEGEDFVQLLCVNLSKLAHATVLADDSTSTALAHAVRGSRHQIWLEIRAENFHEFPCQ